MGKNNTEHIFVHYQRIFLNIASESCVLCCVHTAPEIAGSSGRVCECVCVSVFTPAHSINTIIFSVCGDLKKNQNLLYIAYSR